MPDPTRILAFVRNNEVAKRKHGEIQEIILLHRKIGHYILYYHNNINFICRPSLSIITSLPFSKKVCYDIFNLLRTGHDFMQPFAFSLFLQFDGEHWVLEQLLDKSRRP